MASSSSTDPNRDYLTSLPNEILLKVLSEFPIFNYLDVAHTSRHLRSVLKANAARICNLRISSRYWFVAQYLQTEIKSDWLLPKYDVIIHMDLADRTYDMALGKLLTLECEKHRNHDDVKLFNLLRQLFRGYFWVCYSKDLVHIKISGPGPQYLLLLECDLLHICDGGGDAKCDESDKESKLWSEHIQCECAAHARVRGLGDDSYRPIRLLNEDKEYVIQVKDGNRSAEFPHSRVPKGLIWYYGVDNLVTTWKKKR
jgi:hypothetical protein